MYFISQLPTDLEVIHPSVQLKQKKNEYNNILKNSEQINYSLIRPKRLLYLNNKNQIL